jgi:hypothetical protein
LATSSSTMLPVFWFTLGWETVWEIGNKNIIILAFLVPSNLLK